MIPALLHMMRPTGGGIVIEDMQEYFGNSPTVSFSRTPASGELILIFQARPASGNATVALPTDFTDEANTGLARCPTALWSKIAGGSESNSYGLSSSLGSDDFAVALLISGQSGVNVATIVSDDAAGTALVIPASGQSVSAGSTVFAFRASGGSAAATVGAQSVNNSFSIISKDLAATDGPVMLAQRDYVSAATGQQVTNSWTTSRSFRRGIWAEVYL